MRDLAYSEAFIRATGGTVDTKTPGVSDQRMGAQELVLRFIGFYLSRQNKLVYAGDMNSFLDETLDKLNAMPESGLEVIRRSFIRSMSNCFHLFGQYCFRKCLPKHLLPGAEKQLINRSLFITWSISMCEIPEEKVSIKSSGSFAGILATELEKMEEYYRVVTVGTSDRTSLEKAFQYAGRIIRDHL